MNKYTAYGVTEEDCKDSTIEWIKFSDHEDALDGSLKYQLTLSKRVTDQAIEIEELKKKMEDSYWQALAKSEESNELAELRVVVKAVAHIGVDFGYGKYEIEQKHIDSARKLMESDNEQS